MSEEVLSAEECKRRQEESFARLQAGDLFQLTAYLYCLAVRKASQQEWTVIRLTQENRQKIIAGQSPEYTLLHFDDMECGIHIESELDE